MYAGLLIFFNLRSNTNTAYHHWYYMPQTQEALSGVFWVFFFKIINFNKPADLKGKEQCPRCLQSYPDLESILKRKSNGLRFAYLQQVNCLPQEYVQYSQLSLIYLFPSMFIPLYFNLCDPQAKGCLFSNSKIFTKLISCSYKSSRIRQGIKCKDSNILTFLYILKAINL